MYVTLETVAMCYGMGAVAISNCSSVKKYLKKSSRDKEGSQVINKTTKSMRAIKYNMFAWTLISWTRGKSVVIRANW